MKTSSNPVQRTEKYYSIDGMRAIAAFFIVCLHVPFSGTFGEVVSAFARIAVPFFFMISGFFIWSDTEEKQYKRIRKQIKHLFFLMIYADVLYLLWDMLMALRSKTAVSSVLENLLSYRFLLFNFKVGGHIWFLRALIYVLILFFIIRKLKLEKVAFVIMWALLIIDLFACKYSMLLFHHTLPFRIYEPFTKFACVAYTYFMLGYLIRTRAEQGKLIGQRTSRYLFYIFLGILINLAEFFLLEHYNANVTACNYIGTFLITSSLFLYLVLVPERFKDSILYKIGSQYSLYIYILHLIVKKVLLILFTAAGIKKYYYLGAPVWVYAVTLIVSVLIVWIQKKWKPSSR